MGRQHKLEAALKQLPQDLHVLRVAASVLRLSLKDEAKLGVNPNAARSVHTAYQRLRISHITKAALKAKRDSGQRAGNLPYGYSLNPDGQTLDPNKAEQDTLDLIRYLHQSKLSQRAIAALLNQHGSTTRRGTPWRHQYVASLLKK